MKKLAFIIILLWLLSPTDAAAVIRYAQATGTGTTNCTTMQNSSTPASSIAAAISCTAAGDTITLRGGTYNEGIAGDNLPNGNSGAITTINVFAGETARLRPDGSHNGGFAVFFTAQATSKDWITFDGGTNCGMGTTGLCRLIFDGTNSEVNPVVSWGNGNNLTFRGVEVFDSAASQGSEPNNCVGTGFGSGIVFTDSNIHHCGKTPGDSGSGGYGFYIGNGSNITVTRSLIHDNGGYGFHINATALGVTNVVFSYNDVYSNGAEATQSNNAVRMATCGSGCAAYGNIVRDQQNAGGGLEVHSSCNACVIYNNTVTRNSRSGISNEPTSTIIRNNISVNNNLVGGAWSNMDYVGTPSAASANLCFGTGGTGGGCTSTGTPNFVNAAGDDFHLASGSAAIDAGTPNITIGVTIPACTSSLLTGCYNGSAPDLGAFESGVPVAGGPPVLTMNRSTVAAGEIISLNVNDDDVNERVEDAGDWIGMYVPGSNTEIDWNYMNSTKSAPVSAISDAVLTFTAPAMPASYEFRFYEANSFNQLALLPFTVTAQGIVLKLSNSTIKIGPSINWKIGLP